MILRSIRVENWRCFIEPVEVGPFDDGLNVLYGPNGTGKSTLFNALQRGLLDSHRVGGEGVKSLRPWGRELAPKVSVIFFNNGEEYRITKRFCNDQRSVLERRENGRFIALSENDAADDQVRQILFGVQPSRGLSKTENWGLAQVLWAPQGEIGFNGFSEDISSRIRNALGVQIADEISTQIERRIAEKHNNLCGKDGKPRKNTTLAQLYDNLSKAEKIYRDAVAQHQLLEHSSRRLEDLRARRVQLRRDTEALTQALQQARARLETWRDLHAKRDQRREQAKAAESDYNNVKGRIDAIQSARAEQAQCQDTLRKLKEDLPLHEKEVKSRETEAEMSKAALEDIRRDREKVDRAQAEVDQARRYTTSQARVRELSSRLKRIESAMQNVNRCKKERSEHVAPDAKILRDIRNAFNKRHEAQVRIEAALITLEIVPAKRSDITILAGEETGSQVLEPDSVSRFKGSPEVVVDFSGIARLRATGPAGSIEEHRAEREKADKTIRELTRGFGTAELDELERLHDRAAALDKTVAAAETELKTLLGRQTMEATEQECAREEAVIAEIIKTQPDWEKSPPDAEKQAIAAESIKQSFIRHVEDAEKRRDAAQTALTAALERRGTVDGRLKEVTQQSVSLEARVAELTRDGRSDAEREADLRKAALTWEAARGALEEFEKQIAQIGEDPAPVVAKLEKQLEAAGKESLEALEKEKSEEGRLEQIAAQGTYSALAQAEEEIERLKTDIAREEMALKAVRLLYLTVNDCRASAMAAVAGPVENAATRIFQRIAGTNLGRVKLGSAFEPSEVQPEIVKDGIPLESVSGGEEEQIHLATRLALADVLARSERQLVVLDDVLTATDTGRLARILTILEESAQRLQILILTCHPERYRGLDRANFVDLEALRQGQ